MTDKVVILVTAASKKECRKIAKHLVESKLAACVNITQPSRIHLSLGRENCPR